MTADPAEPTAGRGAGGVSWVAGAAAKAGALAAAALLLGGLTSLAQGVLPQALSPLANSASGWTIPTALLVWAFRERPAVSAVLGALGFECLLLGYVVASNLRGIADSETAFLVLGLVAGPAVGAAAAWLHAVDGRAAVGAGVLAGVLLGDAGWGLTAIVSTTGPLYWSLVGALGIGLLAVAAVRRRSGPRQVLLALATALGVAAAFLAVYAVLS